MLNKSFLLLPVILASALAVAQQSSPAPVDPDLEIRNAFSENASSCSEPRRILVPVRFAERARLKVRLVNLLRLSLFDDAKGIVNVEREKEIKELANKLKKSGP